MTPRTIRRLGFCSLALLLLAAGCAPKKAPEQDIKAAFWPPYPDEPRIQFLTSYSSSTDVAPQKTGMEQLIYGKEEEQTLAIVKPDGIAMRDGKIYVSDIKKACVTVLDVRNQRTLMMGKGGAGNLVNPVALTISEDGYKYVADNIQGVVMVFDPQDRPVGKIGEKGIKPVAVATWKDELYVSDFTGQVVRVYNRRTGQAIRIVGAPGEKPGQFIRPFGLAVDKDGNLFVVDFMTCRLQKFDSAGKLVMGFGTISANAGGLVKPKLVAVDSEGIIYVVDAAFNNVQLFDQMGRVLTFFGSSGQHLGAMLLPYGIAVHEGDLDLYQKYIHPAFQAERLILVTNQMGNNKVAIYAFGRLKPGKTVAAIASSKGMTTEGVATQPTKGPGFELSTTAPADIPDESATQPSTQPGAPEAPASK